MNNPFRRWHVLLVRQAKVAARDSYPSEKQHCQFVCAGSSPDNETIQQALDHLNYQYGDWEWVEVRRKREWRWPWQPAIKVTKMGEGGTITLSEGVFEIENTIDTPSSNIRIQGITQDVKIIKRDTYRDRLSKGEGDD
jgi:hypothetical protein